MPLTLHPVQPADIPTCITIRIQALGSLVIGHLPPYKGYRQEQESSIQADLDHRPNVHHLKVVDTDNGEEIVAYAKWEVHEVVEQEQEQEKVGEKANLEMGVSQEVEVDMYWKLRTAVGAYFRARERALENVPHIRTLPYLLFLPAQLN